MRLKLLKCDKLEMNQTQKYPPPMAMSQPHFYSVSRAISKFKAKSRPETQRKQTMRNRTIITSLLLFYWEIYHSEQYKKSFVLIIVSLFSVSRSLFFTSPQQHPILILFVNNKIPNFFPFNIFPASKIEKRTKKILSMFVCLIIV